MPFPNQFQHLLCTGIQSHITEVHPENQVDRHIEIQNSLLQHHTYAYAQQTSDHGCILEK